MKFLRCNVILFAPLRVLANSHFDQHLRESGFRACSRALSRGDRIRLGIRCNLGDHGVINGTTGTVTDIAAEQDRHALIVARIDGHELLFSSRDVVDGSGRVRLATDYASTVWSSQGQTSETATIVADASFDRRDIYVSLSRAKHRSTLCVDFRALNFAIRAETGFDRASEAISVEERREHLVRQMSRWRTKTSTLDFISDLSVEGGGHDRCRPRARSLLVEAEAGQ